MIVPYANHIIVRRRELSAVPKASRLPKICFEPGEDILNQWTKSGVIGALEITSRFGEH